MNLLNRPKQTDQGLQVDEEQEMNRLLKLEGTLIVNLLKQANQIEKGRQGAAAEQGMSQLLKPEGAPIVNLLKQVNRADQGLQGVDAEQEMNRLLKLAGTPKVGRYR